MKKLIRVLYLVLFLQIFFNCNNYDIIFAQNSNQTLTGTDKDVAASSGIFGISLLKEINKSEVDKNIFLSPLSASTALGMTINGAVGNSYSQMKNTLQLYIDSQDVINQSFLNLNNILFTADSNITLTTANSIWYKKGIQVEQNFLDINSKYFNSLVEDLNFSDPASVEIINNWVKDNTHGKISQIISEIPPYEVMYLINAIYFKAKWKYKFDSSLTKQEPFFLTGGETVQCSMMEKVNSFKYYKGTNYSALEVPYGNGNINMLIILPDKGIDINKVLGRFNESMIEQINEGMNYSDVILHLPKFEVNYSISLKNSLKDLGMVDAFDKSNADFSRIAKIKDYNLYISDVLQKTYIKVGEESTEAAAVTVVHIGAMHSAWLPPSQPIIFNVDHPFIFFITEKNSGAFLFAGKIVNPVE